MMRRTLLRRNSLQVASQDCIRLLKLLKSHSRNLLILHCFLLKVYNAYNCKYMCGQERRNIPSCDKPTISSTLEVKWLQEENESNQMEHIERIEHIEHAEELTIGEVARRAGMRTSALRYYESVGLLPEPRRVYGGHRRYDASIFELLAILRLAQQADFTIAEMHQLVAGFS